jgi:hypothetical protein
MNKPKSIAVSTTADGAAPSSGTRLAARAVPFDETALHDPSSSAEVVVRAREVMETSGRVLRTLHVFCPHQGRSLALGACGQCEQDRLDLDGGARFACRFSTRGESGNGLPWSLTALAAITPVGVAMDGIRCVRSDAPMAKLPFATGGGPLVVVDHGGVPLGAVRNVEPLQEATLATHAKATDLMVPVLTVAEGEPLAKALSLMVRERARHACAVDDDQIATGLISDLSALRWLTRRRDRT